MKILAVEFSSELRGAAVLEIPSPGRPNPPSVLGEARAPARQAAHPTGLADQAIAAAKWEREKIEGLAIGLGPGSYTGIRMAIAFAQGWQLVRSVQVIGVSSMQCMAHQMQSAGHRGPIQVGVDAQRNEFCLGHYLLTETDIREQQPLALAPADVLKATVQNGDILVGPNLNRRFPGAIDVQPDAASLGRLAGASQAWLPAEELTPIYLRPAQFVRAPLPRPI